MKVKYEYDIIDADYGYIIVTDKTRKQARNTIKDYKADCPKQKFAIIQRKYVLESKKQVR